MTSAPIRVLTVAIAGTFACALACASHVARPHAECDQRSRCPAEPPPSDDAIDSCNHALDSRCGDVYRALRDCAMRNETCDTAGRSDPSVVLEACASETIAYQQCVPAPLDAGGPSFDAARD